MRVGNHKFSIFLYILFFLSISPILAVEEIESVPLINLEDLSPTFEEDRDILDKEDLNIDLKKTKYAPEEDKSNDNDKIYINIKALDKITAKTSTIKLTMNEKKYFGPLEIKVLKCQLSENKEFTDMVAYLQVKDLSSKNNNQVFLFNGWTFVSSPTLKSIDHPIYDLWITSCENI